MSRNVTVQASTKPLEVDARVQNANPGAVASSSPPSSCSQATAEPGTSTNLCKDSVLNFETDGCWVERKVRVEPGKSRLELQYGALSEPRVHGLTPGVAVRCRRSIRSPNRDLSAAATIVDGKLQLTPPKPVTDRTLVCEVDNPGAEVAAVRATGAAAVSLGLRLNLVEARRDGERVTFSVEPEMTATNFGATPLEGVHPRYLMAPESPDSPPDLVAGGQGGEDMLQMMLGGGGGGGGETVAQGAAEESARIASGKTPFPLGDSLTLGAYDEVNVPFHTDRLSDLVFDREHIMGVSIPFNPRARDEQQLTGHTSTDYVLSATPVALPPCELVIQGDEGPRGTETLGDYTEKGTPVRISNVCSTAIVGDGKIRATQRDSRAQGDSYKLGIDFAVRSTDPESHILKLRFDLSAFDGIDSQPKVAVNKREVKDSKLLRWDAGESQLEVTLTVPAKAADASDPAITAVKVDFRGRSVIPSGAMGTDAAGNNYI